MEIGKTVLGLVFLAGISHANEDAVDVEFLEWLGQIAEIEQLGVDISAMIETQEQKTQSESEEENSK